MPTVARSCDEEEPLCEKRSSQDDSGMRTGDPNHICNGVLTRMCQYEMEEEKREIG